MTANVNFLDPRLRDSDWRKIQPCPMSGCWIWIGALVPTGYGSVGVLGSGSRTQLAHRYVYTALVGPISRGLHIDHKCRVRCCVNPAHLEAVTQRVNNERAGAVRSASNTHCGRGHSYESHGMIRSDGTRACRRCATASNAEYRFRQRFAPLRPFNENEMEDIDRLLREAG